MAESSEQGSSSLSSDSLSPSSDQIPIDVENTEEEEEGDNDSGHHSATEEDLSKPLDFSMKKPKPERPNVIQSTHSQSPCRSAFSSVGREAALPFFNPFLNPAFLSAVASGQLPPPPPPLLPSLFHHQPFPNPLQRSLSVKTEPTRPPSRPFKAYNPTDPLSALNIAPVQPTSSSALQSALEAPNNYQQIYRQCLLNAQASLRPDLPGKSSPPQVTSTSHPHTEKAPLPIATSLPKAACRPDVKSALERALAKEKPKPSRQKSTEPEEAVSRRGVTRSLPEEIKDEVYWERRRKNNEAAKRSRDTRRQKEDEIAMRAAVLEQENLQLRIELAQLRTETENLRKMLLHT